MYAGAMTLVGLHHVQVNVTDLAVAISFYEALGLTVRSDRPDFGIKGAWLDAGGQQLHLVANQVPSDLGQHFAIEVSDLDQVIADLGEHGIDVRQPASFAQGMPRVTFVRDPAGNPIELREPAPQMQGG